MVLQATERQFGRVRGEPNAPRILDLDILDYQGEVMNATSLVLPHPRLHERRFVLMPIAEIAPDWRHPILELTAAQLLARLSSEQEIERLWC
jgi:2-amino-4-hydroxy-6-hydroxymethyldihydropteridine diphosphokinase